MERRLHYGNGEPILALPVEFTFRHGEAGCDAELAVFITLATFRKALSVDIIGVGKQFNNSYWHGRVTFDFLTID